MPARQETLPQRSCVEYLRVSAPLVLGQHCLLADVPIDRFAVMQVVRDRSVDVG
jgi:hypothetical protein